MTHLKAPNLESWDFEIPAEDSKLKDESEARAVDLHRAVGLLI